MQITFNEKSFLKAATDLKNLIHSGAAQTVFIHFWKGGVWLLKQVVRGSNKNTSGNKSPCIKKKKKKKFSRFYVQISWDEILKTRSA